MGCFKSSRTTEDLGNGKISGKSQICLETQDNV